MLRRLAPAGLAVLGLVALVLAMPSFSAASAQAKAKPKYLLAVHIYGVPTKITLDSQYTYTVKVTNKSYEKLTNKKLKKVALSKVTIHYKDARFVQKPYPTACNKYIPGVTPNSGAELDCTLSGFKPGASKQLVLSVVYPTQYDEPGNYAGVYIEAYGSPGGQYHVFKGPLWP
jgi:hypothetical protein